MRDLIRKPLTQTTTFNIDTTDLFPQYQHKFNADALQVFKTKTNNLIHQYNDWSSPGGEHAYALVELLALLGIKSAINNPVQYVRSISVVQHFGFTCHPSRVDDAIDKISSAVNDMASSKWINASMYNLGLIQLGKLNPTDPDRVCVFSYVAVKHAHEMDVETVYGWMKFKEGAVPPELK